MRSSIEGINEVPKDCWAVHLTTQLMGKAQSILKHYDISEDTYKHRFRRTEKKEKESVSELVFRLNDVFRKWTRECETVEQLADLMVMEQLLNTLPVNVKIWVEQKSTHDFRGGSKAGRRLFEGSQADEAD